MRVAVSIRMTAAPGSRVLVTFGSKREGTAEIARAIAEQLQKCGFTVDCMSADRVTNINPYSAFVIGGAVYMHHWHRDARRFAARFAPTLRERPVWCFSSGPLDSTATAHEIPPVRNVTRILNRLHARGHATFGGRLSPYANGFPASAMARTNAGDWRDWDQIRGWANQIGNELAKLPRREPTPVYAPTRWILAALCLVVGISAVFGGLGLVLRPDGSLLHMPLAVLEHSMFESFLVPGLLLLVVVGLGHLFAAWLVIRHSEHADITALGNGAVLITWIVAEMVLLQTMNALQIGTLAVGTSIIGESLRRLSSFAPPRESAIA